MPQWFGGPNRAEFTRQGPSSFLGGGAVPRLPHTHSHQTHTTTQAQLTERNEALARVNAVLSGVHYGRVNGFAVQMHGSTLSGLCLPCSDLDVALYALHGRRSTCVSQRPPLYHLGVRAG